MKRKIQGVLLVFFITFIQGCNMPGPSTPTLAPATEPPVLVTDTPPAVTSIQHLTVPISAPDANPYPDVTSADTAPEQRAPYGDSYEINRLERPFTQDMTYIPDMDIASFSITEDADWYFVSIELVGKNPNSPSNIQFSVELDTNRDSFGDYLIVAQPPFSEDWNAEAIKIYADTDRDSAGVNASKSDALFSGNGYDQLIYSIPEGVGTDIDLAWVRMNAGPLATIQFAFKKSFAGSSFLYSVLSDAGLKDIARLDYVDYFTEADAGSPVRSNLNYPLKALYAVDNTCYQAFGFKPSGYEPKICPEIVQPQIIQSGGGVPQPGSTPGVDACTAMGRPDPGNCPWGWSDAPYCVCTPG